MFDIYFAKFFTLIFAVFPSASLPVSGKISDRLWWLWSVRSIRSCCDRRILQDYSGMTHCWHHSINSEHVSRSLRKLCLQPGTRACCLKRFLFMAAGRISRLILRSSSLKLMIRTRLARLSFLVEPRPSLTYTWKKRWELLSESVKMSCVSEVSIKQGLLFVTLWRLSIGFILNLVTFIADQLCVSQVGVVPDLSRQWGCRYEQLI